MKKNFFNQDLIKIESEFGYDIHEYKIEKQENDNYNWTFFSSYDESLQNFFKNLKPTKYPTLFRIEYSQGSLDDQNLQELLYSFVNVFISNMIDRNEKLKREQRLGVPENLSKINGLTISNIMGIVNYKILFPYFSIELINENKEVTEVF